MSKSSKSQEERSQETIAAVLDVAEKHFAELGYGGVSTETMVEEAGLTRGALYHHFGNKQGLFEAVVRRIQMGLAEAITASQNQVDPWQAFLEGCFVWLELATQPQTQRILLIDAPAVLGWERWQELDGDYGSRLLREGIHDLIASGIVKVKSEDALFHLMNGAMNQAALWIAQSPKPERALQEAKATLKALLEGALL